MSRELQHARQALRRARMAWEARQYLQATLDLAIALRCRKEALRLSGEVTGKGKS